MIAGPSDQPRARGMADRPDQRADRIEGSARGRGIGFSMITKTGQVGFPLHACEEDKKMMSS
jgi:hypothetical protein